MIRVFIVAASTLARSGLQNLLADRGVEVVGSSPDIDAIEGALAEADALVIDASGENAQSLLDSLARSDLASETPVVVLAGNSPPNWSSEALRNGVRAVLPVGVSRDQLAATLQAVTVGLLVLHPAEIAAVLPAATRASQSLTELAEPLTRREREVLQMLAAGLANKEIADRLQVSESSVKATLQQLFSKTGVRTRSQLVRTALENYKDQL